MMYESHELALLMDSDRTPQQDLHALKQAFEVFTEASGQLGSSWRELEEQVARLQQQLAASQAQRMEEAAKNEQLARRLRTVLETLPGGLIVVDGDGRINEVNSAARDMFGAGVEGAEWAAVSQENFVASPDPRGDYSLQNGRRFSLAQRLLPGDDDSAAGRVLLFSEVTEQRKIEALLERHHRLASMGEMAAGLAHQVRTPLSSALLYASNAMRSDLNDSYRLGLLEKSVVCLKDLEQLVGDMLNFARGAPDSKSRFALDALLATVGTSVAPVLGDMQELKIETPSRPLTLTGNREALAGALINLVRNALQAAGPCACVNIRAEISERILQLQVCDNGPGIAPDQVSRIFEPFVSLRPDGTGLGLAVVRSVARAHNGEVCLARNGPDGASFALRLPLTHPSETVHPESVDTDQFDRLMRGAVA